MKILVTGGLGQLGKSLQKISKDYNYDFLFTDIAELDITKEADVNEFIEKQKPDIVVNAAAYTAVDKAEDDEEMALLLNAKAVENLAKACEKNSCRLVHISTDYVFNGLSSHPYTIEDETKPMSVYGQTKLVGEQLAIKYCTKVNVIRTSWLYSEFGKNFVKTMLTLGKEKQEIGVVYDQVGTPCYATDLAKAIMSLVERPSKQRIMHFSNEGVCSWYDFARKIMEFAGLDCKVRPILSKEYPTKAQRPEFSVLDKSLIKKELNITIPHWEDSLKQMLNNL